MKLRRSLLLATVLVCGALPASARSPVAVGVLPSGPLDAITDVGGIRVGHVTKVEGTNVRTGATAVVPDDDIWNQRVAAATFALNGNGEMTGVQWVDQSGFLEVPIVLTDTLDVGRADDGVVSWLIAKHPQIGRADDVPLPVVAECDDLAKKYGPQFEVPKLLRDMAAKGQGFYANYHPAKAA